MSDRVVYHVVPRHEGVQRVWVVERERGDQASAVFSLKAEAIEHAKKFAQSHALSQVIVHHDDGTIETEYTYGDDPERFPG